MIGNVGSVKAYGQTSMLAEFQTRDIPVLSREGLEETHALMLDVPLAASAGFTQALIISAKACGIKSHLTQLQAILAHFSILVSPVCYPVEPLSIDSLPDPEPESPAGFPVF